MQFHAIRETCAGTDEQAPHQPFVCRRGRFEARRTPKIDQRGIHWFTAPQLLRQFRRTVADACILDINQVAILGLDDVSRVEIGDSVRAHHLIIRAAGQNAAAKTRAEYLASGDRNHATQVAGDPADFQRCVDARYQVCNVFQFGNVSLDQSEPEKTFEPATRFMDGRVGEDSLCGAFRFVLLVTGFCFCSCSRIRRSAV
jgi:hypothetical protein